MCRVAPERGLTFATNGRKKTGERSRRSSLLDREVRYHHLGDELLSSRSDRVEGEHLTFDVQDLKPCKSRPFQQRLRPCRSHAGSQARPSLSQ